MPISLQNLKKRSPSTIIKKDVKKPSRFGGLSEEEVKKNTLEDILEEDLDLVFVGINPSLMAAHTGRYYAGPGNHFYKLLYESKLIPEPVSYEQDNKLLQFKIGLTNIVTRATRSSADLSKSEIRKGAMIVQEKLKLFKPKIAIFNGKCIYEEFIDKYDKSSFRFGLQPCKVGDTAIWVVPSSSARCANYPRMQDKLHFYTSLKKYLEIVKGTIKDINLDEFCFEGKCKQAIPSTSKMWRRKNISAFAHGGRIVNQETICMDTSEENALVIPQSTEFIYTNIKKKEKNDYEIEPVISANETHNSERVFKVIKEKKSNLQQKRISKQRKSAKEILKISDQINMHKKTRTETTDFISLIKQRLNNKKIQNQ